ncbi:hypothetical protein [Roseivivax sp. CAU 1761]
MTSHWFRTLSGVALALFLHGPAGAEPDFVPHSYNGKPPMQRGAETVFSLPASDCSEREYAAREVSDCYHGNDRSLLKSTLLAEPGWAIRYRFSLKVDQPFVYRGGPNRRSLLTVADWRRDETSQNKLYAMHLDAVTGLSFGDTTCAAPRQLAQWTDVEVLIRWHRQDGLLQVRCDGRTVIARRGIDTIVPADCAAPFTYHCNPAVQQPDHPVEMRLGLLHQGYGPMDRRRGLSPEGRILTAPVTVRVRDMDVRRVRIAGS